MLFIDTHWKCVLIFTFNRIMELVLDCSYTYPEIMSRDIVEHNLPQTQNHLVYFTNVIVVDTISLLSQTSSIIIEAVLMIIEFMISE